MIVGSVRDLNRYPVKSMQGERLTEVDVGERGLAGDRAYAVIDGETGKIASAKHPGKWDRLLQLRASFVDAPRAGAAPPPVTIEFPDGTSVRSDGNGDADAVLSRFLERPVTLAVSAGVRAVYEELWPLDVGEIAPPSFVPGPTAPGRARGGRVGALPAGLAAPPGTFFALAVPHLMPTSPLAALRAGAPGVDFDARRFRPNVLVETTEPGYVEDEWVD